MPALTLLAAVPLWWVATAWIWAGTLAVAGAVALYVGQRGRRAALERLGRRSARAARGLLGDADVDAFRIGRATSWRGELAALLDRVVPGALRGPEAVARLASAGWFEPEAVLYFGGARLAALVVGPTLAVLVAGELSPLALAMGLVAGAMGPQAVLDRRAGTRRTALAVAVPDALDLLVVCLEAGVGVDAALQRVAREIAATHPVLSTELEVVTRRIGAGLPREEALRSLVVRTGVDDLRAIVGTMIQAERLGTSLARVLRIHGEALRTRRKQLAEKKAAEASVKMVIPLVLFLLPAFFAVVLGPAALSMLKMAGD